MTHGGIASCQGSIKVRGTRSRHETSGRRRDAVAEATHKISVFTADDHELLRAGIAGMIAGEDDLILVGEAATGADAVKGFRELVPDVTLMDLQMSDFDGVKAMATIRAEFPSAKIIVLTTYRGDAHARNALLAGAMGYLLKSTLRADLIETIRAVHAGQHRISAEVAQDLAEHFAEEGLTPRELTVLRCVADGLGNAAIAKFLGISVDTVKDHVSRIMSKLKAKNRAHAITVAIKRGIMT